MECVLPRDIDPASMQEFPDIAYKPGADKYNTFDLYVPPGSKPEQSGLVCFVHGGAWKSSAPQVHNVPAS